MDVTPVLLLTLGSCVGGFIRGLVGFGGAILNLCVWVVFSTAGLDAGSLQQAVMVECVSGEMAAIPLLWLTDARNNTSWALVLSLLIFGGIGSPIGAALLLGLNPRLVEFVMATILLIVIGLHYNVLAHIRSWLLGRTRVRVTYEKLDNTEQVEEAGVVRKSDGSCVPQQLSSTDGTAIDGQCVLELHLPATSTSPGSKTAQQQSPVRQGAAAASSDHADASSEQQICQHQQPQGRQQQQQQHELPLPRLQHQHQPALQCELHQWHHHDTGQSPQLEQQQDELRKPCEQDYQQQQTWHGQWQVFVQSERFRQLSRMLGLGAVTGVASGIMSGLTGMGGPPLMYLYDKLALPKDVVRASNSVLGALQPRIVAYIAIGAFKREDVVVYGTASAASLAGMFVGNSLAGRVDQAAFSKVLVALMLLCCALMYASAAGLAS